MKTIHTHRGTCQRCGSVQAVDNKSQLLAKHGYTVEYNSFHFVCGAAGISPAEHDVTYTRETIANCIRAAESNEREVEALKSGKHVPSMFKRWNPKKVKVTKRRDGSTYNTTGDYDVLPIAKATPEERQDRINAEIAECESNAAGFRGHAAFLTRDVLSRLGKPLYPNEELSKKQLTKGLKFTHEGVEHELVEPAFSRWGNERLIGWYVRRVGADEHRTLRWTSKEIRNAMNPKPVVAAGGYTTKKARKDDLDKLNRVFDTKRKAIQDACLAVPHDDRTEAQNAIYWGPMQLSHWRPKHGAAVIKEFPALTPIVQDIEALVAERARIKAAPGV